MTMEAPVSAFAMYKHNKTKHFNARERKRNAKKSQGNSPSKSAGKHQKAPKVLKKPIPDDIAKTAAKKIKENQKNAKVNKTIGKNKNNKKKQSPQNPKQGKVANNTNNPPKVIKKKQDNLVSDNIDERPPIFMPALNNQSNESDSSDASGDSFDFEPVQTNSVAEGYKVFAWLVAPYRPDDFLNHIWEKKPLHISRKKPMFYKGIISTPLIDNMLRTEDIQFSKNIDITSYVDEKRETHNPVGRAHPHVVWDYYLNGCSIRLLNPQTYLPKLHLLNATLQEFFHSFVGANAYLTPPDSQGFAPHYDDIEAFIMQIEGKKLWNVYKPREENEVLPRVSSKNFNQDEIGDPILEVTLEAGDLLYFPRGYIHQGVTIDGEHSLHITVSMYQKHSWADLFEKMIPAALQTAINENVDFRKGLPFDLYENFGLVHSDNQSPRKQEILAVVNALCDKIKFHIPFDNAVDEMAKNYQVDALPPVLTDLEKSVTVFGDTDVMVKNGKVKNRVEINLDTRIRLLRKNVLRMVMEEECIRLYYYVDNSLEYHGKEPHFLEIDEHLAPAVETLLMSYPEYVFVENLDVMSEADKLQVASDLWERGLIMTEYPLDTLED